LQKGADLKILFIGENLIFLLDYLTLTVEKRQLNPKF